MFTVIYIMCPHVLKAAGASFPDSTLCKNTKYLFFGVTGSLFSKNSPLTYSLTRNTFLSCANARQKFSVTGAHDVSRERCGTECKNDNPEPSSAAPYQAAAVTVDQHLGRHTPGAAS